MSKTPQAIFIDLDDTILDYSGNVDGSWREACAVHHDGIRDVSLSTVQSAIDKKREWFWSDPDRHRVGRLDMWAARREVVRLALEDVGIDDPSLAARIADKFSALRDEAIRPYPDALEAVQSFRQLGYRLALLTNGNGVIQRRKVSRFGLEDLFDLILIEGEVGFGKPDPRIYRQALEGLGVTPAETWMVGDNLEWDVFQPQRMGIFGIWVDMQGRGLPEGHDVQPNRIVRRLAELCQLLKK